jgi:hypothetical protein
VAVTGIGAAPASAAEALELRIERDLRPGALSSDLAVNLKVTVTDPATAAAPAETIAVYAYAEAAGRRTDIYPCAEEHDNAPEAPPGLYLCTVLVDYGGTWVFHSVANRPQTDEDAPPETLGATSTEIAIDTAEVARDPDESAVRGRVADVVLLWSHAAAAGGWFLAAGLVSVLALPGARRRLSGTGVHRLEERFGVILKGLWAATGLVVGSGIWLLLNQTAYDTPFSSSALDGVFSLPYGEPYFVALGLKVALYGLMLAAVVSLTREARRRLRVDDDPRPSALARLGAGALLAGALGVSVAVTVVKYCHELIEAAGAVT